MKKKLGIFIWILFTLSIFFTSFKSKTKTTQKKIIMLQKGDDYKSQWSEVDRFNSKKLPKSALEVVNKIYQKAKQSNNDEQIIKALFYKAKYEQILNENSFLQTLDLFKNEAEKAKDPVQSILYSIVGEFYWNYYQNNRWKIQNRTHSEGVSEDDIKTWDIRKIIEESTKYYLLSLENLDELSRTPVNNFSELIVLGKDNNQKTTEKHRPYLLDFLGHRAIDFFINEEPNIVNPKESFKVNNEDFYLPAKEFTNIDIELVDNSNLKNHGFILLQEVTKAHVDDLDKTALIDVELKRINFVKNNSLLPNKDALYLKSLEDLLSVYRSYESSSEISYKIAEIYSNKGNDYSPNKTILENEKSKNQKRIAKDICQKAIAKHPGSFGAVQCQNLLNRILTKQLSFTVEKYVSPNTPLKTLVNYKNIDEVFFRIVEVDFKTYTDWYQNRDYFGSHETYFRDKLMALKPIIEWSSKLENDNDHNAHSTEIEFEGLKKGHFVLLASENKAFQFEKGTFQYSPITSTNLSYISRTRPDQSKEFFVIDRESGVPLEGVIAEVFLEKYDYKLRRNITTSKGVFTTNKNGSFKVKKTDISSDKRNYNFYVVFSKGDDLLNNKDYHNIYFRNSYPSKTQTRTHFYTDRAIYRPGQTVHFKGIVIDKRDDKNTLKTGYTTTVEFLDVNWQKIKEVKLTTNEYGSFSGSFITPEDRLNGMMHLRSKNGSTHFSVEEYKRPKFEIEMKPITGTYKLDENVRVKGEAKTYSGAPLDGANVSYRVARNGSFPFWCWYRWGYMPSSPEIEITNGTIKTDDDGGFAIDFAAVSDKTIDNKFSPTYSYTVYVDVTDLNGETHSSSTVVRVSNKALIISADVKGSILLKDFDKININSTNLNGEFEPVDVFIEVWSLEEKNEYYIDRKWAKPEKNNISSSAFEKSFPIEPYGDEHNVKNWKKKTKVFSKTIHTGKTKEVLADFSKKQASYYIQLTATDKYGTKIKDMKYFRLIDEKSKQSNPNIFFELTDIKTTCEPGERASFLLSTAAKNVKVFYQIERKGKLENGEWLTLNNEQRKISIPVTENDRGNFSVHVVFVKHNRSFSYTKTITVPYSSKKLEIEFTTFRDKLLPGQNEEWEIKIRGPKGEKILAEMMAGMYDASLDAFRPNSWSLQQLWRNYYSNVRWENYNNFNAATGRIYTNNWNEYSQVPYRNYATLNRFGYRYSPYNQYYNINRKGVPQMAMSMTNADAVTISEEAEVMADDMANNVQSTNAPSSNKKEKGNIEGTASNGLEQKAPKSDGFGDIKSRTNFNELAFFFPQLSTDKEGNVCFKFTVPESLTKWKFMSLAHTKDLKVGTLVSEAVTQKDLMVYPNSPRFFRENDEMVFSSKITNLSNKNLVGEATIVFYNSLTNEDVTKDLISNNTVKSFSLDTKRSNTVKWEIKVPEKYSFITYKVMAKAGNFTDGEEKPVPVLTNRMMVTESLPLPVRSKQKKTFTLDKLLTNKSTTLKNHKLTLEFTSNPAWYAVQALPYLMEYPYDCAEQTFSRYYANAIASHIANSSPKIKEVFTAWENSSPEAFLSNLEKNQELKSVLLEETPWVLQAKNESERKKRVGLLFNLNKMSKELNKALAQLQKMQKPSGGWPWFEGMRESRYITQHIATGLGHLDKLGVKEVRDDSKTYIMVKNAIKFLDAEILRDYQNLLKYNADLTKDHVGNLQIQYLYARSFFPEIAIKNEVAYKYYFKQAKQYWVNKSQYMQAMISLTMNRTDETAVAKDIIKSIKEYSIESEEMGMYWKQNAGYYWYQAPIETQAMFIEAFAEVTNDQESVESMKVWLLKQKQTQDWKTTKATTEACYALLLQGNDWLASDDMVEIQVGNEVIDAKNNPDIKVEAGTGYFKTSWNSDEIKPEMGTVKVHKKDEGVSWGALYWQYFEQLDKITPAKTPLSLEKKLFVVRNTKKGPIMEPIADGEKLKVGDKVRVRVILRSDRDMEYVHLKDMRASGFEPTNVFSGYRYQDGLGYYETTKDASTNFFIGWLSKGTYVFEYDLRANIEGNFSNGITSIQCMYAPEFASHSEGVRVSIEGK